MFLGIVVHAAIPFLVEPGADAWPVRNRERSLMFDLTAGLIHSFRMQLFYLLCGFFGRLVHERIGTRGFLKHRLLRVGLPFAIGMLTIVPLVHILWRFGLQPGATAHLWFIEYLLIYSLAAAPLAQFTPGPLANAAMRWLIATPWKSLLLALGTALLMLWSPIWDEQKNARGVSFAPNLLALAYYALFYAFGWMLHRHSDLLPQLSRWPIRQFALGFVTLIAWGMTYKSGSGSLKQTFAFCVAGSLVAWLLSFAMIGLFLKYLSKPSAAGRYLADASYWVYLAHLPLIILLQKWILPWPLNPWLELALIHAIALPLLLVTYQYGVRHTVIGWMLNGKRSENQTSFGNFGQSRERGKSTQPGP